MCMAAFEKKQPFLFIVFGTSKHNIEVGGYGGNVCIYGVSCGWLFFLKNPGRVFFVSSLVQHTHTDTLCICVSMLKKTGNRKNNPDVQKTQNSPFVCSVFFEEPGESFFCFQVLKTYSMKLKTGGLIHPFVCFSASCPFCPRGHGLTLCISRCIKTYCTHRIDSEVIADLRFSASKISPLPPKILVPATLVPLPQFRDVICVALLMQRTCNTHATHMQHTCNTTCNTSIFPVNLQSTCRIWRFQLNPSLRMENVDFHPRGHFSWKFPRKRLVLHVVLHVCCMCVACVLHVRCMSRQGHTNHIPELGKWDKRGRHKNFGWQARDFGSWEP